ncbi:hypothetical protein [Gottfriedia acidiceleris]|uniref:hypothetical protein n=1 Tax=Gottfriedia acidiceleris TaxID=371036 RepID=UPI0030009191
MKKFIKIGVILLLIIIIFCGGFISGKLTYNKPTREIRVGYETPHQEGVFEIRNVITDVNNQDKIDNIQQVLAFAKQINNEKFDLGKPNLHLFINSPKEGVLLIHAKIWFTRDGAIVNMGDYRKVSLTNAKMLKKIVGYKDL